jgi:hypothetical protein
VAEESMQAHGNRTRSPALRAIAAMVAFLACPGGRLMADEQPVALPAPAEIRALDAFPTKVSLPASDAAQQLVITAALADGRSQDLSRAVAYEISNPGVVRISPAGRVTPLAQGDSTIVARFGAVQVSIPVSVGAIDVELPLNFANQVVPVFTKLGCNSGGCHGKLAGQNGFRLSLLGFEPTLDFETLVHEARGRRVFPAAPDHSLLLLKAAGRVPHGGGKRTEVDSDEYKVLRRWIASGLPYGAPNDPVLTAITVEPSHRRMTRRNAQQFAVTAHYSDGSSADITRRAQYESNDPEIATVDEAGLVQTQSQSGEAAVMVRYQGQVTVFRATVPLGMAVPEFDFPERTLVDRATTKKWRELSLVPSALCTDAEFIRRAALDISGTLPTPTQIGAFTGDRDPLKRVKLVDALLDSGAHADFFASKWAEILRVSRRNSTSRSHGTYAFHEWIREAIASDMPYDEFTRSILGATGDETRQPPTVWYKELQQPEQLADDTAQVFLGLRIACAQCHHHPYEVWGQDDYWGLAAFFGRLKRKPKTFPGEALAQNQRDQQVMLSVTPIGSVINKRTNRPAVLKPLGGAPIEVPPGEDPRQTLADWMAGPENPYFARAVVNRYWAHFFGRGIVEPLDDMRQTNPPSNPELLDALALDLVAHGTRLKHLIRTICNSRTYQLSAEPNESNLHDTQSFARYYPKRLSAEVLYDALAQVTDTPADFSGLPKDSHAPHRAIALPDESFASYFLDVFGRPQRLSACECERVGEANLAQVLHLLNSSEVRNRLTKTGGRADRLASDPRPDATKVDELFLWALGHEPTSGQREAALAHIARRAQDKKAAYEDILWSLVNTKEFEFNH